MDMHETKNIDERLKNYEPLFETHLLDGRLGSGGFGTVYRLRHIHNERSKAAVKVITVPDEKKYKQLNEQKINGENITEQIGSILENYCREIDFLEKFRGHSNIVSISNYSIKEVDGIRRDILIKMEYLTDLDRYTEGHELSENDVIRLGIDICTALEVIQRFNIIHLDIKPQNIFISPKGNFKLGDFGIARCEDSGTESPGQGTQIYVPPEVWNNEPIGSDDKKADMYSLGLVLYELLNNRSLPFEDKMNRSQAAALRLSGKEPLPPPQNSGSELSDIVLKACAYGRENRFENVTELKNALIGAQSTEGVTKTLPYSDKIHVPPISGELQKPSVSIRNTGNGSNISTRSNGGTGLIGIISDEGSSENTCNTDETNDYAMSLSDFLSDSDDIEFMDLLNRAIGGEAAAQNNLGNKYFYGESVEEDYKKAFFCYLLSAKNGDRLGQYNLSDCYYNGEGVEHDDEKAVYWLTISAGQGYGNSQNTLGNRYSNGEGVEQSHSKAIFWYRKSAEQGNKYAQFNLGNYYNAGIVVEKSSEKAIYWYTKSAEQEFEWAQEKLLELQK